MLLAAAYLLGVHRARRAGAPWPAWRTAAFLVLGVGSLALTTTSFLSVYNRVLLWPGAVQNVLLVAIVPVGLSAGQPVRLLRRAGARPAPRVLALAGRVLGFPLVGSLLAVGLLVATYTTGYAEATLRHPVLLAALHVELLAAGCLFLWPLLGVDDVAGGLSYPFRAAVAFADGLLDALAGLAILAGRHGIATAWFRSLHRPWGPSPALDQRIAGTAVIVLSELVGLPALLVLLVRWAATDSAGAAASDDLDEPAEHLPWWVTDPGPLARRAAREGWTGAAGPDGQGT